MAYTIAVAGKGGSGKTTVSCLLARYLVQAHKTPILAVDADPNVNFNVGLGLDFDDTIADLREEGMSHVPSGMSKLDFVNMRLQESVIEGKDIDLLVMGRPEGSGCYCAVNHLLRDHLSKIAKNYKYVIIDNEAGMEHLSRRTTDNVNLLFLVSDPSVVGLRSCARAYETVVNIPLKVDKTFFILNRVKGALSQEAKTELAKIDVPVIGEIPFDSKIVKAGELGANLLSLLDESVSIGAMKEIMQKIDI